MIKKLLKEIIDFALPPVCVCCDNTLEQNTLEQNTFEQNTLEQNTLEHNTLEHNTTFVCSGCLSKLKKVDEKHNIWGDRVHKTSFNGKALSLYWFIEDTEIQHILHALKYSGMKSIGRLFGKIIGNEIQKRYPGRYDYAVPVPLHKSKFRERTYNQSDYICRGISESLSIQPLEKCLKRSRYTKTQTKLSINEREENVRSAFKLNDKYKETVKGKNIILVDDVITTGSTILECSRVLKISGCGEVTICSIALAE